MKCAILVGMEILITLVGLLGTALLSGFAYWLHKIDKKLEDTNAIVRRELRPNGGLSIFDKITDMQERLKDGDYRFSDHAKRIEKLEGEK